MSLSDLVRRDGDDSEQPHRPGSTHPQAVYSVALLVLAGADADLIVEHVDRSRSRSGDGCSRR